MQRISVDKDYKEAREEISIVSVLNHYGYYENNNKKFTCPFHRERTPSASVKNNRLKCFGCGKVATTIDIVIELEGVDQFTAVRKLLGSDLETSKKIMKAPYQAYQQEEEKNIQKGYEDQLSYSRQIDKTNIGYIKKYLNDRCISGALELSKELNNIDILHNYSKKYKKNFIIYNFPKQKFMVKKAIDRSCKLFYGSPRPVYFKLNATDLWFIVEGIEDCFSLLLAYKFNVICLNSTSNINKFIADLKKKSDIDVTFVIATDLDNSGEKAKNELIRFFKENNIIYSLYNEFYNYAKMYKLKDVNACLIHSQQRRS